MPNYLIAIINKMNIYNYLKSNQFSLFLSLLFFYPSIRLLIIGSEHSSALSILVGLFPKFLFVLILSGAFFKIIKDKDRKTHLLDKLVFAYFLYNVLTGCYLAHDLKAAIYGFQLTYLPMLGYFVCSYYWDKKVDLERLFYRFFQVLVLIAVLGLIIYFIFPGVHLYFHKLANGDKPIVMAFKGFIRMTSILWTPVVFAMLMLCAFCYWTYRYFKSGNIFELLYSLITVNAIFFSVSRGPMISSFVALLLLMILCKNGKYKLILAGVLILELLIFYLFAPQFTELMKWFFVSSKQTATLEETNTRVNLWREVMNSVKHNPMGLGLGKAGHVAVQLFPPGTKGVSRASTDGWYFKLMIETGISALVMYLSLGLVFFIKMIRYLRMHTLDFVGVIFVIFVTTGLVNLVSNALDFYLFSYFYWFLLGFFVFKLKQESR
ncbi:O-antigen ligase family protein [Fluviicola sp.]|jgi:hypothetical protein|uniref:O-antigen ligase family protein n=1 Tax=Fluviicola sp. TaxID=1917219 RepID=UPI0028191AE1|nr:O-antigen ligase family protein [Fluviicola sp.]MDR0802363.1 O-antigen ligase family protein [Fluviicola sp.]